MAPVDRDEAREQRYLIGPQSRRFERVQALKVFREYLRALRAIHALHPSVTVFGSGHLVEGHAHYDLAREAGARLADAGFTVMTGGGPGLMEAPTGVRAKLGESRWRARRRWGREHPGPRAAEDAVREAAVRVRLSRRQPGSHAGTRGGSGEERPPLGVAAS